MNALLTIVFQSAYATFIIRLLIRIVSDFKVNYNNLSDLDEMFHSKKDSEYNSDTYISNFLMLRRPRFGYQLGL